MSPADIAHGSKQRKPGFAPCFPMFWFSYLFSFRLKIFTRFYASAASGIAVFLMKFNETSIYDNMTGILIT